MSRLCGSTKSAKVLASAVAPSAGSCAYVGGVFIGLTGGNKSGRPGGHLHAKTGVFVFVRDTRAKELPESDSPSPAIRACPTSAAHLNLLRLKMASDHSLLLLLALFASRSEIPRSVHARRCDG